MLARLNGKLYWFLFIHCAVVVGLPIRKQIVITLCHESIYCRILSNALKLLLVGWFGIFIILPLIFKFSSSLQRGLLFLNFSEYWKFISLFISNLSENLRCNIPWESTAFCFLSGHSSRSGGQHSHPEDINGVK